MVINNEDYKKKHIVYIMKMKKKKLKMKKTERSIQKKNLNFHTDVTRGYV
jgi:hypothetical protein